MLLLLRQWVWIICKEEIEMSAFQGNENVRFGHFC